MARGLVLDAGALIAAENRSRLFQRIWDEAFRNRRIVPLIPAPVLGQYWRGGDRKQAPAARLISDCIVVPIDEELSKRAGVLLGRAGTSDITDAIVVAIASDHDADIATSDPDDIRHLIEALGSRSRVIEIT